MSVESGPQQVEQLSHYRSGVDRIRVEWPAFLLRRRSRLQPHPLLGEPTEKVTESILEDLLTNVLDWPLSSFNPQVGHADILLTDMGIRRLIIEAKRPDTLSRSRAAISKALDQAIRYAAEQKVGSVAISDGTMFYAVDLENGGMKDRLFVSLEEQTAPIDLWWISACGIYRSRDLTGINPWHSVSEEPDETSKRDTAANDCEILHPKYKLPARCFAFVPDASAPHTWKLPYLQADGAVDAKRLPKAIQSIVTNFRGTKVSKIPEAAIPAVLERLATAATISGRMPPSCPSPAPVYVQLRAALEQLGIVIRSCGETDGMGNPQSSV